MLLLCRHTELQPHVLGPGSRLRVQLVDVFHGIPIFYSLTSNRSPVLRHTPPGDEAPTNTSPPLVSLVSQSSFAFILFLNCCRSQRPVVMYLVRSPVQLLYCTQHRTLQWSIKHYPQLKLWVSLDMSVGLQLEKFGRSVERQVVDERCWSTGVNKKASSKQLEVKVHRWAVCCD